jgi:hypothetical protein
MVGLKQVVFIREIRGLVGTRPFPDSCGYLFFAVTRYVFDFLIEPKKRI